MTLTKTGPKCNLTIAIHVSYLQTQLHPNSFIQTKNIEWKLFLFYATVTSLALEAFFSVKLCFNSKHETERLEITSKASGKHSLWIVTSACFSLVPWTFWAAEGFRQGTMLAILVPAPALLLVLNTSILVPCRCQYMYK